VLGLVLALGACSDRAATPQDTGPIWPDTFIDAATDSAVKVDVAADQAAPDGGLADAADASTADAGPATGWTLVKPTFPLTADLHGIACVSGNVYAVGDSGTVIHNNTTTGKGFSKQSISTTANLHTISFADLTYGVAAGEDPQIWQTQDTGLIWSVANQCSAYIFKTFYALHLYSASEGFGAGEASGNAGAGAKYYAGYSWVCTSPTYPGEVFYDVFRLKDSGWSVGDTKGKIYTSTDMGLTWTSVSAGTTEVLRGVHFTSAAQGVAVGAKGAIVRSTDGLGKVWGAVTAPTGEELWDVSFHSAQNGWAVGANGTVLQTTDGGKTWTKQASPTSARLEAVCFTSASEGFAVGEKGTILHTTTGGL